MNETLETKNIYSSDSEAFTPMKFIKRFACGSKKLLFVVIAYMSSLAASLIGFFGLKVGFSSTIAQFIELFSENLDAEAAEFFTNIEAVASVLEAAFVGIAIVALLPTIIMAVGSLLIYLGAKKDDPSTVCHGSLLIRILLTFYTVVYALGIALVVIFIVASITSIPEYLALAIIAGFVLIVPLTLSTMYYGKFAKMFKNLSTSVRTDINVLKVSSFVTVINWIFAVCGIISAVTSLGTSFLTGIGNLLSAISLIIITTAFSEYKDEFGAPTKENIQAAKEYLKY